MKALIVLLVTAAYPVAAQAQLATTAADASASTSPLMTASSATSTCSISSDNGVTSLDWSWGASNSGASSIVGKGLRVTSTLSGAGGDPVVSAHAIKTKGAGGVDRSSSRAGPRQTQGATFGERYSATPTVCAHAITTKGAGADGRLTRANAGMAPRDLACHIRPGDGVTIFNPPPPSSLDKVSVQDFHFVVSNAKGRMAGGPGGGPHVLTSVVCSGADSEPNSVTMLLLPAVQK